VSLTEAISRYVEAHKICGDVVAAANFFKKGHKTVTPKGVADVAAELIRTKEARNVSPRYLSDLRGCLKKFSDSFRVEASSVTTQEVQTWLDGLKSAKGVKLSNQTYVHRKRVLHLLFKFAVTRGYSHENPVLGVDNVKVKHGETLIYTPDEIARLLKAAKPGFLPCLAVGAFCGLRSAEIQRLQWSDVDLVGGHVTIGANRAKTGSRRVVPIHENLAAWLAPLAGQTGSVWKGSHFGFYGAERDAARAAGMIWRANAMRHSFASYRLAETQNAAMVALEMGNSPQIVFKHYYQLVKPADAVKFFNIKPETPANVTALPMEARA
jgi:integrase